MYLNWLSMFPNPHRQEFLAEKLVPKQVMYSSADMCLHDFCIALHDFDAILLLSNCNAITLYNPT